MSKSKNQSIVVIGCGLIILSVVMIIYAFMQPRILIESVVEQSSSTTVDADSLFVDDVADSVTVDNSVITKKETNSQVGTQSKNNDIVISYPLNLNTCTEEELITINGIGNSKASAIIQYRDYLGGYDSVEQIKNIKGIGEGVYEKIAPYLTV